MLHPSVHAQSIVTVRTMVDSIFTRIHAEWNKHTDQQAKQVRKENNYLF